jgi:Ca2+-binding RTX toxin-like protein
LSNLTGGTGNDAFNITPTGSLLGTLNANSGTDTLNLTALPSPVTVNLQTKSAPSLGSIVAFESYLAPNSGGDQLIGTNSASSWSITGANLFTLGSSKFNGFETLTGGSGNDTITLQTAGSLTAINGGGGVNLLMGPNVASSWNLVGIGSGDVNGTQFTGMTNLTGGTLSDVMNIAPTGSLAGTLNLNGGDNTLSYTAWLSDVQVNTAANTATAIGTLTGSNVTTLIGGGGNDTLTASNSRAMVLVGGAGNDLLTAGTQRSLQIGGIGSDQLLGGSADNLLIGGTTAHDANTTALITLLNEWKSGSSYALRLAHLRGTTAGGLNGTNVLANTPSDTLFDDLNLDTLTGNAGQDWFIASAADLLTDRVLNGSLAEAWDDAGL